MRVAIIGSGFTGLAAAFDLAKSGHQVTVFESSSGPGGLAAGFTDPKWAWPLECHYHHLFRSDRSILDLAAQIHHPIIFTRPKTSTWLDNQIFQLDSPLSLLNFTPLPFLDRLKTAAGLATLKFNPFWQPFEYVTAKNYITTVLGNKSWQVLWEPLFLGKFGQYSDVISAAWFWSRIYKRSSDLGYPEGGFLSLANALTSAANKQGAKFYFNHPVNNLPSLMQKFDRVICTLPTPALANISGLQYPRVESLGAVNLVLALTKPFFPDHTYWLNINDRTMPFLAVVEHTNFQDPNHYHGDHLLYIGNYLPSDHAFFSYSAARLLKAFLPHLQKIQPGFQPAWVRRSWAFKAAFAQPIVTTRYSRLIPPFITPIKHLYLANIQQVYPWDRGTNYAVELGLQVAKLCTSH